MPEDSEQTTPSSVESNPVPGVKPVSFRSLISKSDIPLYEEIGSKYDVQVTTISEEGEQYTHYFEGEDGKPQSYTGAVPQGGIYGEISSTRNDLGDFWKEFRARQQPPSVEG